AAVLVIAYFLFNFWSVKLFARSNTAITLFKLIIPALTAVLLIASGFHAENFSVGIHGELHKTDFASVLTAVAIAGIVFSFNGFQSPVNLAGEARNPGKSIPFAIVCSIVLATVIYVLLQVSFIGAVPRENPGPAVAGHAAVHRRGDQPQRHRHDLHRHHRAHALRHGAQRHAAEDPRPRAPQVGRAAPGDVGEPGGVVPVPVLLPRLGHAGGGDLGGHDHFLPDRPGQRDDAAPHRARPAPPAAPRWLARARRHRVRDVHRVAVLGQVAADRRDHPADGRGAAGVLLLPGQGRLARFRPPDEGRLVAGRLPARDRLRLLGRQHYVRRQGLLALRLGSGGGRRDRLGVLSVGREVGLAHAVGGSRRAGSPRTSGRAGGAAG